MDSSAGQFAGILYLGDVRPGNAISRMLINRPKIQPSQERGHLFENLHLGSIASHWFQSSSESLLCVVHGHIQVPATTLSPAEWVARSYKEKGASLFSELQGSFTLALLDEKKKELFLLRDRMGSKPLYWFHGPKCLIFCTHLKGMLRSGFIAAEAALDGLASSLFFGYCPQDMTPIRQVSKLLPSHFMHIHLDGRKTIHSYWSYSRSFTQASASSLEEAVLGSQERAHAALEKSLSPIHQASYVLQNTPGCQLLLQMARGVWPADSHALLLQPVQEHPAAPVEHALERVAWHPDELMNKLPQIVWNLEEPLSTLDLLPSFAIKEHATRHSRALLLPVGTEEFFGAPLDVRWHPKESIIHQIISALPQVFVRKMLLPVLKYGSRSLAYGLLRKSFDTPLQAQALRARSLFSETEIATLFPSLKGAFNSDVFLHKFHHLGRIDHRQGEMLYLQAKTRLPDSKLLLHERLSAMLGGSTLLPWLDEELVQFLAGIPPHIQFTEGNSPVLLQALTQSELPAPNHFLQKRMAPLILNKKSLKYDLREGELANAGLLNLQAFDRMLPKLIYHGRIEALWMLLVLEVWFRLFISMPIRETAPESSLNELLDPHVFHR